MIGVLSLNPCVDKTMFFEKPIEFGVNLTDRTFVQAGGKGTNVIRVLNGLGRKAKLFTVIAGDTGQQLLNLLQKEEIETIYTEVSGLSRMYITVLDKEYNQIALKENGPSLTVCEVDLIKEKFLRFLENISFLCISDSFVCNTLVPFYAWAVSRAKERGIPVMADLDGEALKLALEQGPDIIKPNIDEYAEYLCRSAEHIDIESEIRALRDKGIGNPVISLGEMGAVTLCGEDVFVFVSDSVKCVNPVGCGDSFIAGLVYGYTNNWPWKECMRWATAAGAANCEKWEAARLSLEEIKAKLGTVRMGRFGA